MREVVIPYKPRAVQRQIHAQLDIHRFSVVVAHRRMGKTVLCINQLNKEASLNSLRNPRYGYVAPFYSQAKEIAWDYLKFYTRNYPGRKVNESELSVVLPNGARIKLYGADNPDSLRGGYFDNVVLDEYADMKPSVWNEVVRPMLSDRNGKAIFIGTPKGLNQFHEIYQLGLDDENWYADMFPVDKTGILSPEELESARATMTEAKFRQEYYCDFTASSDDVYIPLSLVEPALGKRYQRHIYEDAPKILGVDPARFGDDSTEIYIRQGLQSMHVATIKQHDTVQVANRTARFINELRPAQTFIDEVGLGAGVVDRLTHLGFEVMGVNSGRTATKEAVYRNKRAEMWGMLKQWLIDGGALPDDRQLASQLSTPLYEFDPANRIKLEKKEDMKKRGLKSPDKADALALTFAYPVHVPKLHEAEPWHDMEPTIISRKYKHHIGGRKAAS